GELPGKKIEPPSRKVHIDVRLDEVVLRALEKDPERRYQQASVLKTQVETIAATSPGAAAGQAAVNQAEWASPENWTGPKWLSVYFSKRDSRVWVPKQIPAMGHTVNLGNPRGMFALFAIITAIIVLAIALPLAIFTPTATPVKAKSPATATQLAGEGSQKPPGPAPVEPAAQLLSTQPPVVVETFPISGLTNVPPGETEIRVRFSKPMADGSWSWSTAWEDSTPETIGEVHYLEDHRTCIMKVRLEPGRTYGWWLNSQKFGNFKGTDGQSAVPYLLIFRTAAKANSAGAAIPSESGTGMN
ncbi:MAG TPA: Ig-like domain-containing protein, partial [Verrucomicrobiae bacterium]